MGRWFLAFGLLTAAVLIAFVILSVTGVIDAPGLFWQIALNSSRLKPHLETYSQGREAEEWIAGKYAELEAEKEELVAFERELKTEKERLEQEALELTKKETQLQADKAAFAKELNQRHNVRRLAEIYREMSADEAARLLEGAEQNLALQILTWMDERDAADILTKLPTNLAVSLSKQLRQENK